MNITNHVIFDLPKKTRDFFEHGIKIDIDFATTTAVTIPESGKL